MSSVEEVVHLSDVVVDLKQRVEALERELAALKPWQPAGDPTKPVRHDLGALWDSGTYSEKDFEHG